MVGITLKVNVLDSFQTIKMYEEVKIIIFVGPERPERNKGSVDLCQMIEIFPLQLIFFFNVSPPSVQVYFFNKLRLTQYITNVKVLFFPKTGRFVSVDKEKMTQRFYILL